MKHVLIGTILLGVVSIGIGEDTLRAKLKAVPKTHPRLFINKAGDADFCRGIETDPVLSKVFARVQATADKMLALPTIKRKKTGKRLLSISRLCLKRVFYLSISYRVTKDRKYALRAQEEMLAAAGFSDWNPSHFLDVGEMTAALAIGYDWLYDVLTEEARKTIKAAIVVKGLKTSLKGGWWVKTANNWNQVCHGGLTLGSLAVLEDEPELAAQIIERAIKNVPRAMHEYSPDGAYPEGPGYWKYGTTYNVIFIAALESVLGTDFGLAKSKGFLQCSDYYLHATGPAGLYFNYSDCGSRGGVAPAMYWFASKRKKPSLLWHEKVELKRFLDSKIRYKGSSNRMFPFLLLWGGSVVAGTIEPKTMHWTGKGPTPVAMHRSGWKTPDEIYVGVKAGSPGANHGHMDIGSFVLDASGVRWAVDLGAQSYHSLESKGIRLWGKHQDSQRWSVFRLNSLSHNILVVNGKPQVVKGFAPIVKHSENGTVIDMLTVYKGQLASAKRGVRLWENRLVLVQDEIKTLGHGTSMRWGMVTRAKVTIKNKQTALLEQDGKTLYLKVLEPVDAQLELYEVAKPPNSYDAPNKDASMIGFTVKLKAGQKARLRVVLSPGKPVKDVPQLKPLVDWD